MAQFVIYLIDLVQDLRPSSKWEELRLLLVSLLRSENAATSGRTAFLYQRNDLRTENYLDTFNKLPVDSKRRLLFFPGNPVDGRKRRLVERARRGFPRELSSEGLRRNTHQQSILLRYKDSPGDIKKQLESLFT
jgi:hypothetical protein